MHLTALTTAHVLTCPRPDRGRFILDTDCSYHTMGAVLSQEIDGEERVISYFSKSLTKTQRNFCVTRKEHLAMVKSIQNYHHYLYGRKFLLTVFPIAVGQSDLTGTF